jgi:dipeptidyl aminopeptidase/acylaminoacyl peptidase
LLGLRFTVDAEVTQWLDADMAALQDQVDRLLPATGNRLQVPKHGDSPWILVEAFADRQPTTTYAYQRVTRRLVQLGNTHPGLSRSQLGTTDLVHIPARDGLDIPTYLTLPPGENKKNLPLVVLVHGGPWLRGASWHFDPQVQFLASRGYAVLQAEFRGGTGFGRRHFTAGFKQWGRAMQDDLADATRWAVAQGHADARRICIAGASYGGYATLMGLINDPDLYRCGVEWVGVTDIGLMFSVDWSDVTEEWKKYGQLRLIGDPKADAEALAAVSPLQNAARLKQPLLMAYGEFDARVPLIHGEKFRDAVKAHNPQVEWVVYEKEGHGWSKPETRIDFWGRVEKFLARHIGTPP